MRLLIILASMMIALLSQAQPNLHQLRLHYTKAVVDKKTCKKMVDSLKYKADKPIFLAYLGGFQTIWAKHASNPLAKWKSFSQGRKNIEKAIEKDPESAELRYIRLSVQKNAPAFLGYRKNMEEDIAFLKKHRTAIVSDLLLKNIETLIKQ